MNNASILRRLIVVFTSFIILEKILANLHNQKEGEKRLEFSPLGAEKFGESSIFGVNEFGEEASSRVEPKLILLWNDYQMIGKKIYGNIFRRITDGKCPVSNCRSLKDMKHVDPLILVSLDGYR